LERPEDTLVRRYRDCVGCFATGVTVVTVHCDGRRAGMTLNSFTSVSLDPLLVSISLAHETRTLELLRDAGRFAVSILEGGQRDVALDFAADGAGFPDHHTVVDDDGFATVRDALAVLRCTVKATVPAGDHDLIIGAVTGFHAVEGKPLVFHRGSFGTIGQESTAANTEERP
jgi:flavin reductase (DIM6/NTAB) family NADH-FMN oxidoreductase RutF